MVYTSAWRYFYGYRQAFNDIMIECKNLWCIRTSGFLIPGDVCYQWKSLKPGFTTVIFSLKWFCCICCIWRRVRSAALPCSSLLMTNVAWLAHCHSCCCFRFWALFLDAFPHTSPFFLCSSFSILPPFSPIAPFTPILKLSVSRVHESQVHLPSGGWTGGCEREKEKERESECEYDRNTSSVKECGRSSVALQHKNKRKENKSKRGSVPVVWSHILYVTRFVCKIEGPC